MGEPRSTVSGLRTRFSPKSRVGQGFVAMAPWLDAIVLLLLFILVDSKFVVAPGVDIYLPKTPVRAGVALHDGMAAVMLSVESTRAEARSEIVFFDDEPFAVADNQDMQRLEVALRDAAARHEGAVLLLFADARIAHGSVTRVCDLARAAGITRVNVATRDGAQARTGW